MAKDSSFDIVSEVDLQEVDNAFQQTLKELVQRYDLKDSGATIEFSKAEKTFTLHAPSDFIGNQVIDVLNTKLVRRQIDLKSVAWAKPEMASGGTVRIKGTLVMGIEAELARKINKDIKEKKFKVKVQIEGDKLRVSGSVRDELQAVIAFVKAEDYGIPLQFTNYR
ncbi:MAG: YajQ family cyclic di-GMP-binding protein [Coriobacteriia bacterium]|nr:YajQ family cyclic di-GMP-binding protein [Coriobacteriia bacterium]